MTFQTSSKAHCRVPVEPVHYFWQIVWQRRFQQIMHMVAHNAQSIELETINFLTSLDGVKQHLTTFVANQPKFAIIAPNRDVIAVTRSEVA
jgi:hypothetical protein